MPAVDPLTASRALAREVDALSFADPVAFTYNPLLYAQEPHENYLRKWALPQAQVLLLGMNPGPFGMAQTGVPFGEINAARDWLRIRGKVGKPSPEHPKRPILGFDCPRSEVSGRRLWGWAAERFGNPEAFFQIFFVTNYCPLAFLEEGGKNRTPDHLPASEKEALFHLCDRHLLRLVNWLEPKLVVGIGKFAESRARAALGKDGPPIGTILHPSPASPAANQGWQERVEEQFRALGVELPSTSL